MWRQRPQGSSVPAALPCRAHSTGRPITGRHQLCGPHLRGTVFPCACADRGACADRSKRRAIRTPTYVRPDQPIQLLQPGHQEPVFRDLGPDVIPIRIYNCDNVIVRSVDFKTSSRGVCTRLDQHHRPRRPLQQHHGACAAALGDGGGSWNIARHNILVNPGQVGAFIAGGTNNQITDNIIIGQQRADSNVGLYVWNQSSTPCSGHTVARNRVV
jgi:hypothetical protein